MPRPPPPFSMKKRGAREQYHCGVCHVNFVSMTWEEHRRTTLHIFSESQGAALKTTKIPESNKGYKMLQKIGWKEGEGLGSEQQGIKVPIATEFRTTRAGIGAKKVQKRVTHYPAEKKEDDMIKHEQKKAVQKKAVQKKRKKDEQLKRELYSDIPDEYADLFN